MNFVWRYVDLAAPLQDDKGPSIVFRNTIRENLGAFDALALREYHQCVSSA